MSRHRAMMEGNSGYQELMGNAELRRKIATYIVRAATPELIGYTAICDQVSKEFNEGKDRKDQIGLTTAFRYILQGRKNTMQFVFENLIKDDPAYEQFVANKAFRDAFLESMQKHHIIAMDYSDDYLQKVGNLVADMHERFHLDVTFFAKYFLSDKWLHEEILKNVQ